MKLDSLKDRLLKFGAWRRVIQLLSFVFFSAVVFNLGSLPLLLPVMWTWGLNPNTVGDAFTAVQFTLYEGVFPWLAAAPFLLFGILIGKSLCGWVCPFGFAQDLIGFMRRRKGDLSIRTHDTLVYGKFLVLAITLFIGATFAVARVTGTSQNYERSLGIFTWAPFTVLSPAEMLFSTLPNKTLELGLNIAARPFAEVAAGLGNLSALFWTQLAIMCVVLGFVFFIPRGWCRYFCPHGAIMALFNRFSFLGLRRDPVKCAKGGCRLCVQACPMRVPILDLPWEKFSHPECIYCMKCVDVCKDSAIKLKYP